jgi:hypothetical protein
MKKLIFSSITILFLGFQGQCKNELDEQIKVNPNSKELAAIGIYVDIEFGRGAGCFGKGLCTIKIGIELRSAPGNFQSASSNGNLTLVISDENLVEIFQHFHEAAIVLEEAYTIPDDVVRKIGLKSNSLKAGTYKVIYNESTKQNEVNF